MGDAGHFARNSSRKITDLIEKQTAVQTELSTALNGLRAKMPQEQELLRSWSMASFSLKELENNWRSLHFAFKHLIHTDQPEPPRPKIKRQSQPNAFYRPQSFAVTPPSYDSDIKHDPDGMVKTENIDRPLDSSSDETDDSDNAPFRELFVGKTVDITEPTRESVPSSLSTRVSRSRSQTPDEQMSPDDEPLSRLGSVSDKSEHNIPVVRQSLRRALELSKTTNEIQEPTTKPKKKKRRETKKVENDSTDESSDDEKTPITDDDKDPKRTKTDDADRSIKKKKLKISRSKDGGKVAKRTPKKAKLPKTPKDSNDTENVRPEEKGKPWSKTKERKTPIHILDKRKEEYHKKKQAKELAQANGTPVKETKEDERALKHQAELERQAELIAQKNSKIYPKPPTTQVLTIPVSSSYVLSPKVQLPTRQPALAPAPDGARLVKTPPHILQNKKEYYLHNREEILKKQREYKKRQSAQKKMSKSPTNSGSKSSQESDSERRSSDESTSKPGSPERQEQEPAIRKSESKHMMPKKRWTEETIHNGHDGHGPIIPAHTAEKNFFVEHYLKQESQEEETRIPVTDPRLRVQPDLYADPDPPAAPITDPPADPSTVGSTNGRTTPQAGQRNMFKKKFVQTWNDSQSNGEKTSPDPAISSEDKTSLKEAYTTREVPVSLS